MDSIKFVENGEVLKVATFSAMKYIPRVGEKIVIGESDNRFRVIDVEHVFDLDGMPVSGADEIIIHLQGFKGKDR